MREKPGCPTLFAFLAKGETTAVCDFPDVPTQGFSTARMVSRSARNDRSNEGAPSLRLRSGQARVSHVFWRDRAGDFDFIGPVREVKIPTLPHRTREGWAPGFVGDVEERPFMAAFSQKRFAL